MRESNNFNTGSEKPIVLLSPLDWGLGHTTRCIPIIHELLHQGCHIIIACNSTQKALLIQEFPQLQYEHLSGYDLTYSKTRWGTIVRILIQTPKILTKINTENSWLNNFLKSQAVDLIISDNRFGFYAPRIPSVFITHQLYIKTGLGRFANRLVQWLNFRRIERFSTCWVPDYQGKDSLAGLLSNPRQLPAIPVRYLGGLSRFTGCESLNPSIDLLIILSGPEPQRSLFEDLILKQLEDQPVKWVLVRGLPQAADPIAHAENGTIYNHAPASLLNSLICAAEWVISRSGYTTVMDLLKLGKKSILVPTPGQAEQEYLAAHLYEQRLAYSVSQSRLSLAEAQAAARQFPFRLHAFNMQAYKEVIGEMIRKIRKS
ncbi:glycosyltransferase [Longitalea arenae]|uniref:glycosyltransferase n=1 Tax=Longitalea arenae TaxID=2812558 RepID=UPI00196873D8|nr:glycosyltransferase [Longitalea arenae]